MPDVNQRTKPNHSPTRLKSERVQEELRDLAGWQLTTGGDTLELSEEFPDRPSALTFAGSLLMLAAVFGWHPNLSLRGQRVDVTLHTPEAGGVTDRDLRFARTVSLVMSERRSEGREES